MALVLKSTILNFLNSTVSFESKQAAQLNWSKVSLAWPSSKAAFRELTSFKRGHFFAIANNSERERESQRLI